MMQFDPASFANAPPLEPTLKNLAIVLRNKNMWPKDFEWDYRYVPNCAMGMVRQVWGIPLSVRNFNISESVSDRLFINAGDRYFFGIKISMSMKKVTPERVAKLIDRYLETGKC